MYYIHVHSHEISFLSLSLTSFPVLTLSTDSKLIPEPIQQMFDRVRNNADFMPLWQMEVRAPRPVGTQ